MDVVHVVNLDDPNAIEGIMPFATRNLRLQVLNDYIYDFNHKPLLWILCVKNHSHILMGHVINRWWSGNKMEGVNFHHFYFIYIAYMIVCGSPIVVIMIKKWLQVIWYEHKQPCPPLPTYLPIYLPIHLPIYPPPTHPFPYLPTIHPPHPPIFT